MDEISSDGHLKKNDYMYMILSCLWNGLKLNYFSRLKGFKAVSMTGNNTKYCHHTCLQKIWPLSLDVQRNSCVSFKMNFTFKSVFLFLIAVDCIENKLQITLK